ncbi:serine hydrolase domain-containing protein [Shivajiella indica]|uniref:Serine hydrolase domain-containing protein n=1 Tax=Shivajiella indica TaxID=872115 RepID=A0ABW5BA28_9BACT
MKTALIFCLILFTLPACSQNTDQIASIFLDYHGENPGAAVAIIHDSNIIYHESFGMADREKQLSVQSTTNFRLPSISKQFTATAILILEKKNLLKLDWTLDKLFDNFPEYGNTMQIQHLLNHTSGIWDYEDFVPDNGPQVSDADVLEIIKNQPHVYFEAGSQFRYSNSAYALLALIVEKYSGQKFQDFLKNEIFDPLEMKNSVAFVPGYNEVLNRAFGYSQEKGEWIKKDQSSTSAVLGDGGIYSNVPDLFLWDRALHEGKILPRETIERTFSKSKLNNGHEILYGLGWHLKEYEGEKVVYHTGSTTSFRNIFYRIPSKKLSIIILTNRNKPEEENMVDLAERVLMKFQDMDK